MTEKINTPESLAREAQAFLDSRDMTWEMRNFLHKVRDFYRPDAPARVDLLTPEERKGWAAHARAALAAARDGESEALADLQRIADRLAESRYSALSGIAAEMNEALLRLAARGAAAPTVSAETRCAGGEEVAVDWHAGLVLHEGDAGWHPWDDAVYGEPEVSR